MLDFLKTKLYGSAVSPIADVPTVCMNYLKPMLPNLTGSPCVGTGLFICKSMLTVRFPCTFCFAHCKAQTEIDTAIIPCEQTKQWLFRQYDVDSFCNICTRDWKPRNSYEITLHVFDHQRHSPMFLHLAPKPFLAVRQRLWGRLCVLDAILKML